jgi:SAM-dependent methyltransferase
MLPPPGRIFEIGYGTGELLVSLHADGYSVAGVDSGQADLEGVDGLPAGALRRGSAAALRLDADEAAYDLVVAIHVVEHVVDPIEVLGAAHNVLRPGGRILVITPDADSLGLTWFGAAWWMLEDPTHVGLLSAASLTRACTAAGFGRPEISRPLLDSLSCEAASLRRRGRTGDTGGRGVLAEKRTLALATATLPVDVLARLVWPRLRPALLATASR